MLLVGALVVVLFTGLQWALEPEARPDPGAVTFDFEPEADSQDEAPAGEPTVAPPTGVPTATETSPEEDPELLIAQARPPSETTVQVLDAGSGSVRIDAAVAALEALGYNVVAISPSRRDVSRTTVYFTATHEPEAKALRARDPRVQVVEPNEGLSEGVDLHVLVGPDWR